MERETLHINDGVRRIAMVETKTTDTNSEEPGIIEGAARWRYQLDNHLGSSNLEVNESAEVISYEEYHPYGSTAFHTAKGGEVSAKRYRYTGKEKDSETGLYYHGARYYAAWLGRWTAADPLGVARPGSVDTTLYAYVEGNPVRFKDPTGTDKQDEGLFFGRTDEFRKRAQAGKLARRGPTVRPKAPTPPPQKSGGGGGDPGGGGSGGEDFNVANDLGPGTDLSELKDPNDPLNPNLGDGTGAPGSGTAGSGTSAEGDTGGAKGSGDGDGGEELSAAEKFGRAVDSIAAVLNFSAPGGEEGGSKHGSSLGGNKEAKDPGLLGQIGIGLVGIAVGIAGLFSARGAIGKAISAVKEAAAAPFRGLGSKIALAIGRLTGIIKAPGKAPKIQPPTPSEALKRIGKKVSGKQRRHVRGTKERAQRPGGGELGSVEEAQAVLDAAHAGEAELLGITSQGHVVVRYRGVTGVHNSPGTGTVNQPTNVFLIKGSSRPSVVPTSPNWKPK